MSRNFAHGALAALFLLLPAALWAGGPPFLCLPLEGVNAGNAQACTALLNAKMASRRWQHEGWPREVKILERANQWYLAFYMGSDVRLSGVAAALEGSQFSVPFENLRLFGHAKLEIDAPSASRQALLADLEELKHVSVAESRTEKDLLVVAIDMPYPVEKGRSDLESVGWEMFQRNDFASDPSTRSETPAKAQQLPGHGDILAVVAKHNARLKDIRWSTSDACRPLGCAAGPAIGPSAQRSTTSGR